MFQNIVQLPTDLLDLPRGTSSTAAHPNCVPVSSKRLQKVTIAGKNKNLSQQNTQNTYLADADSISICLSPCEKLYRKLDFVNRFILPRQVIASSSVRAITGNLGRFVVLFLETKYSDHGEMVSCLFIAL